MAIIAITLPARKEGEEPQMKMVNTVNIDRIYTPNKSKEHADSNACIIYNKPHATRPGSQEFDFTVETTKELWALIQSTQQHQQ
jgi:hypothetical protein